MAFLERKTTVFLLSLRTLWDRSVFLFIGTRRIQKTCAPPHAPIWAAETWVGNTKGSAIVRDLPWKNKMRERRIYQAAIKIWAELTSRSNDGSSTHGSAPLAYDSICNRILRSWRLWYLRRDDQGPENAPSIAWTLRPCHENRTLRPPISTNWQCAQRAGKVSSIIGKCSNNPAVSFNAMLLQEEKSSNNARTTLSQCNEWVIT